MMSRLNFMITIVNRPDTRRFFELLDGEGLEPMLATVGRGTAASEVLDYFGLEASDKTVFLSFVLGKPGSGSNQRCVPGCRLIFRNRYQLHSAGQQHRG